MIEASPLQPKRLSELADTPLAIVLNGISFFFVLFHTITWFNLAPKAMVMRVQGKRVPDWAVVLAIMIGSPRV